MCPISSITEVPPGSFANVPMAASVKLRARFGGMRKSSGLNNVWYDQSGIRIITFLIFPISILAQKVQAIHAQIMKEAVAFEKEATALRAMRGLPRNRGLSFDDFDRF